MIKINIELDKKKLCRAAKAAEQLVPESVKSLCREASQDIDAICERDPAVKSRT